MYGVGFFSSFSELHLDIVGIVAILGEGSTSRNSQASSLSWHHLLPRIYPAPQALLRSKQKRGLPVEPGIVVGAMSGRIRNELNFFTQLLHNETELPEYGVQLLEVEKKDPEGGAFEVKKYGHLAFLSVLGCCMSVILLGLSLWQHDGPALCATLLLSATSSCVGLASSCSLDASEEEPYKDRKGKVPLGDVIIYYPDKAAFRVVRCSDKVSRLYFRWETCEHYFGDDAYRTMALFSTVLLMSGLIMLGNSGANMQAGFAMSYILLNAFYWGSSALDPAKHVWKHNFEIKELGFTKRMITQSDGLIVPQQSELSPAIGYKRPGWIHNQESNQKPALPELTPMVEDSSEYYLRGRWVPKRARRVRSVEGLPGPGVHAPVRDEKKTLSFIDFALGFRPKHRSGTFRTDQSTVVGPNKVSSQPKSSKRTLTSALWTVIAITGTSQWARTGNIAPDNNVWNIWLKEAEEMATGKWSRDHKNYVPACISWIDVCDKTWIALPRWDNYQGRLAELFVEHSSAMTQRWESPTAVEEMQEKLRRLSSRLYIVIQLRIVVKRVKLKRRLVGTSF